MIRFARATALLLTGMLVVPSAALAANVRAETLLNRLTVTKEVVEPAYSRDKFVHWTTVNGCTTRQSVLRRHNLVRPLPGCRVATGRWYSAYDGRTFRRARYLDIDHMIPLAEAWGSGAHRWTAGTRKAFANDLRYAGSLIAVSASSNRSKGDRDPAEWLPTRVAYRCTYLVTWVAVKSRWQLTIDAAEKTRIARLLRPCSVRSKLIPPPPATLISIAPTPAPPSGDVDDERFDTCAEAKAAGFGPYRQGLDPEYEWYTDGDADGVVCE